MKYAVALLALVFTGCVERELRVESEPTGADVYLDGKLAGKTPYSEKFIFYGTRGLLLRRDGYTPAEQLVPIRAPWYQIIPLDFIFEFVWPGDLKDLHEVRVTLEPLQEVDAESLIEKAKLWRANADAK